ncbi:MAG: beta-ketoacyl-ACP synthase 3, partial [Acidimicrobiia bacterium]
MRYTSITGWGKCLPPAVLANADLEQLTDTSDEWIITRTGIKERRISHVEVSDLGTVAGLRAVAAAGLEPTDIDFIITATCSPDRLIPSAASVIQEKMGAVNAGAMDLNAACSGWIYGLSVAHSMVASKAMDRVLIIGVEKLHFWLNFTDRSTSVLFGDGAGAVLLEPSRRRAGVLAVELGSDGSVADILCVGGSGTEGEPGKAPPPWITMEGPEVFRRAVVAMGDASLRVVEEAGLKLEDVDLLI